MQLLVLCSMLAMFLLTASVLYPLGYRLDRKKRRLHRVFPPKADFLSDELRQPFAQRVLRPVTGHVLGIVSKINVFKKKDNKSMEKLARQLKMAGIQMPVAEYSVAQGMVQIALAISGIGIALALPALAEYRLLALAFAAMISLMVPTRYLKSKVRARQEAIRKSLPDVMDLLVVSVEAGLGFDSAILRLYDKNKGPLMQELAASVHDVQMGLPRRAAMRDMGERNDVQELRVFAGAMVQAEQLGVSIKNVLTSQADQLRLARKQKTEAKAMKAPIKMMLPTVAFIFPVMFIILLGPAVLNFMENF